MQTQIHYNTLDSNGDIQSHCLDYSLDNLAKVQADVESAQHEISISCTESYIHLWSIDVYSNTNKRAIHAAVIALQG